MNKSKLLILGLLVLSVAHLDAGIKQSKVAAVDQAEVVPEPKPKTLEEQHMVIPIGKRQAAAQQNYCKNVKATVFQKINDLVENSNGNLIFAGDPNLTKAPRIAVVIDPQTNQSKYIHYQPQKPVRMVGNKEQYINELDKVFGQLEENYATCGLALKTIGGKPPVNWLAWYQPDVTIGKSGAQTPMGSPKVYLVLENIKPTIDQVKAYEATKQQETEACPLDDMTCPVQ